MKIPTIKFKKESKSKKVITKGFDQGKWIRGFTIGAVAIWIFYALIVDLLPYAVASFFQKWLPATTVN